MATWDAEIEEGRAKSVSLFEEGPLYGLKQPIVNVGCGAVSIPFTAPRTHLTIASPDGVIQRPSSPLRMGAAFGEVILWVKQLFVFGYYCFRTLGALRSPQIQWLALG